MPAPGRRYGDASGDREDYSASADIAERLQRLLLPQVPPQPEGLDVAFAYRSASAGVLSGGDFIDYYSRSPGALAFAIGDVAGKGVEAMAVTFVTKYILRAAGPRRSALMADESRRGAPGAAHRPPGAAGFRPRFGALRDRPVWAHRPTSRPASARERRAPDAVHRAR